MHLAEAPQPSAFRVPMARVCSLVSGKAHCKRVFVLRVVHLRLQFATVALELRLTTIQGGRRVCIRIRDDCSTDILGSLGSRQLKQYCVGVSLLSFPRNNLSLPGSVQYALLKAAA